ncbi:hypothetical protein [Pseudochryseolinea flava]|uniref:Uncharacterized protein n=1 Tax=Pseudochryseolinea flava TaxID=2059302 RepID=A0A364Y4T9_9BACT|nr:hypothetical protein [Pseudochryseolinea flava]RAW00847.1 hypothetical protein DQQ10_11420 [Pseudochryseolinea flava]
MFNSVALDVAIGLMFIFLLYSLLATVISEIVATMIGLRARNLKEAVNRMLNDEEVKGFLSRLWDSMNIFKNPSNKVVDNFYNHPEIKYLGSSGIFKNPSSFKAISFSKTLFHILFGNGPVTREVIDKRLKEIVDAADHNASDDVKANKLLDKDTAQYILNLWSESYGDIIKFKFQLETWFDRTMEQATEWYKRKIRIVLLILGFMIAWIFNADTLVISGILSKDKEARAQMVTMAAAYLQNNKVAVDTGGVTDSAALETYSEKMDSLLQIKNDLQADINDAHGILGLGCWPLDSMLVTTDPKTKKQTLLPPLDLRAIPDTVWHSGKNTTQANTKVYYFTRKAKWKYFFNLFPIHFFGFFLTAVAISLGAPFWFDILNKVMKLRTSEKIPTNSPNTTSSSKAVLVTDREG